MNAAAARYGMRRQPLRRPGRLRRRRGLQRREPGQCPRPGHRRPQLPARSPNSRPWSALREYRFDGPAKAHVLYNHNKLLARYPGATGLKTGYTSLAGNTFVGTAQARRPHDDRRRPQQHRHVRGRRRPARPGLRHPGRCAGTRGAAAPRPGPGLPGPGQGRPRPGRGRPAPGRRAAGEPEFFTVLFFVMGSTGGVVVALRRRAERRRRARAERRRRLAALRRAAYLEALDRRQLGRRNGHPGPGPIRDALRRSRSAE